MRSPVLPSSRDYAQEPLLGSPPNGQESLFTNYLPAYRVPWWHTRRTRFGSVVRGPVVNGVNGLVVWAGDVAALRNLMRRVLADPALRQRLGAAARAAVAPYYYDAMAEAFGQAFGVAMR
jgi:hypothetical protein